MPVPRGVVEDPRGRHYDAARAQRVCRVAADRVGVRRRPRDAHQRRRLGGHIERVGKGERGAARRGATVNRACKAALVGGVLHYIESWLEQRFVGFLQNVFCVFRVLFPNSLDSRTSVLLTLRHLPRI